MLGVLRCVRAACPRMDPAMMLLPEQSLLSERSAASLEQRRGMARGRNYYIKGASNKQDISEETRDLLKNARNPEDYSWKLGSGIQEPIIMDPTTQEQKQATQYIIKYRGDMINDGEDVVKYYPHRDEQIPEDAPSPVLMVRRVKHLKGEPWFNRNYCTQIGLGDKEKMSKLVFLPNIPSVSLVLFKIKHLLDMKPVTFPNGIPEDFNPETDGYKLKHSGEFVVHPSLRQDPEELVKNAEWLKIEKDHIKKEAEKHWDKPYNSHLGHSNYHADTRWRDNTKAESQYVKNMKKKFT